MGTETIDNMILVAILLVFNTVLYYLWLYIFWTNYPNILYQYILALVMYLFLRKYTVKS